MIKLKDILNEKHVPGHDKEGKMAKFDAKETYQDAIDVFKMIDEYDDLPEWLEAKITKATDYMNSVKDYLTHHQNGVKEGKLTENGIINFSKEEMAKLHKDGKLEKDGHTYTFSEGKLNEGKLVTLPSGHKVC